MDELYSVRKKLEDLYRMIPKYERDNNIETPEAKVYEEFKSEFIAMGRKVLEDESLSLDDIEKRIEEYSISSTKEILSRKPEDALDAFGTMETITRDAIIRLENCLIDKKEDSWKFHHNEIYASDREFLAAFSEEDIEAFRQLEDYIGQVPDEVLMKK